MPVSRQHERLVGKLIGWIESAYFHTGDVCLYADHIDWPGTAKPLSLGGYIPDVYATGIVHSLTIIGEAETVRSLEGPHAADQISAFIDFLSRRENPVFVMAVPWVAVPRARGMVRKVLRLRGNPMIQTVCLERLE